MPAAHDEKRLNEARTLARGHGLIVSDKGDTFAVYRRCGARVTWVGSRRSADGLYRLIEQAVKTA